MKDLKNILAVFGIVALIGGVMAARHGQILNRSGNGEISDADGDTGFECGTTDDQCLFKVNRNTDFTLKTNELQVDTGSVVNFVDTAQATFGTSNDSIMFYSAACTPDATMIGLGSDSRVLYLIEAADYATDFALAQQTNPTFSIQSAAQGTPTQRLMLTHDQTNGVITTGAGDLVVAPAGDELVIGTGAAGKDYGLKVNGEDNDGYLYWDEDNDKWVVDDATDFSGAVVANSTLSVVSQTLGIDFSTWRIFDNIDAILDQAAADDDDLTLVQGTPGTNATTIETIDCGGLNDTTQKALMWFIMPPTYKAGSTATLKVNAGMVATVADQAATLDFSCWVPDYANEDATVSTDLITTVAQDVNSLTFADEQFTLDDDASGYELDAGTVVQCLVTALCDDDGNAGDNITIRLNRMDVVIST